MVSAELRKQVEEQIAKSKAHGGWGIKLYHKEAEALLAKPLVYVSTRGGIAEAMVVRGDAEVVEIDWDEYEDNIAYPDNVLQHIEDAKALQEDYPAIWDDLFYWLGRSAGDDLEAYDDEDTAIIMDALDQAGHPWQLSEARQLPMDLDEDYDPADDPRHGSSAGE